MQYRDYRTIYLNRRLFCRARTKSEARSIFKKTVGLFPTDRLRTKVRVDRKED